MKPLAFVGSALLLAALQAALLRWVGGGWFSLTLVAACIVYVGLHGGNVDGSVAAAGMGYVLDLMSGSPKGLMTFLAVLLFVAARAVSAAVDVRGRSGFALLSGLGSLFLAFGGLVMMQVTVGEETAPGVTVVPRMLLDALLTGALSPLVLAGLKRLDGAFHREEPGLLH